MSRACVDRRRWPARCKSTGAVRWSSLPLASALAVAALAPSAGCIPEDLDIVVFDERFEGQPGGQPGGPPDRQLDGRWALWYGAYTLAPTVHPAEHALVFERATALAAPMAYTVSDEYSDGAWVEYTSDCHGAPAVSLSWAGVDAWAVEVTLPTAAAGGGAFQRVYANLPPIPDATPDDWSGPVLAQLVLRADPWAGPCAIDNLRVMVSAPDDGW